MVRIRLTVFAVLMVLGMIAAPFTASAAPSRTEAPAATAAQSPYNCSLSFDIYPTTAGAQGYAGASCNMSGSKTIRVCLYQYYSSYLACSQSTTSGTWVAAYPTDYSCWSSSANTFRVNIQLTVGGVTRTTNYSEVMYYAC